MRRAHVALLITLAFAGPALAADLVQEQHRQQAREHCKAGQALLDRESFEKAVREFKESIRLDPEYTLAHYGLGQAYMALHDYPSAVSAYLACRETVAKRKALTLQQFGEIERERDEELRDARQALERWRGVIGSAPNQQVMRIEQRIRLLEQERNKGFGQDLSIPPEISLALGSAYFRQGELEGAEREYREAIAVDASMGAAHNNLAVVCMMTGRLDEAEQLVRKAEAAGFPVNPRFKRDLAAARARRDQDRKQ